MFGVSPNRKLPKCNRLEQLKRARKPPNYNHVQEQSKTRRSTYVRQTSISACTKQRAFVAGIDSKNWRPLEEKEPNVYAHEEVDFPMPRREAILAQGMQGAMPQVIKDDTDKVLKDHGKCGEREERAGLFDETRK